MEGAHTIDSLILRLQILREKAGNVPVMLRQPHSHGLTNVYAGIARKAKTGYPRLVSVRGEPIVILAGAI